MLCSHILELYPGSVTAEIAQSHNVCPWFYHYLGSPVALGQKKLGSGIKTDPAPPFQAFVLPHLLFLHNLSGLLATNLNLNDYGHKSLIVSSLGQSETRFEPCWKELHWDCAPWSVLAFWEGGGAVVRV